jgi:DNA-binding helix-hairpin-helix protein with protein kinase domain
MNVAELLRMHDELLEQALAALKGQEFERASAAAAVAREVRGQLELRAAVLIAAGHVLAGTREASDLRKHAGIYLKGQGS